MSSNKVYEFNNLLSNQDILGYLKSISIKSATEIQAKSIPVLLKGGNYILHGSTGSGKTFAYLLPLFQKLKEMEKNKNITDEIAQPKSMILLPTRELALQVFGIAKSLSHFAKLRIRKLIGGDKGKTLASLYESKIDILIATPDRCLRSFKNRELRADSLKNVIFDEADQLLEPSFKKITGEFTSSVVKENMEICLVSASRPKNYEKIINEFFPQQNFITIGKGEENILNHKVKTYNYAVDEEHKFHYGVNFVMKKAQSNGLIFMGNKARAKKIYETLKNAKLKKIYLLHKDLEIKERVKIVDKFRSTGGILIATDIFARGIDIPHLQWVLNFDLPSEGDYYLHRSGRVGRVGRSGDVFNFIAANDGVRKRNINHSLEVQGRVDLQIFSEKVRNSPRKIR